LLLLKLRHSNFSHIKSRICNLHNHSPTKIILRTVAVSPMFLLAPTYLLLSNHLSHHLSNEDLPSQALCLRRLDSISQRQPVQSRMQAEARMFRSPQRPPLHPMQCKAALLHPHRLR
jgi:hypothetical protein